MHRIEIKILLFATLVSIGSICGMQAMEQCGLVVPYSSDSNGQILLYNPYRDAFEYPQWLYMPFWPLQQQSVETQSSNDISAFAPFAQSEPFTSYSRDELAQETDRFLHSVSSGGETERAARRFDRWSQLALNEIETDHVHAQENLAGVYSLFDADENPGVRGIHECGSSAHAFVARRVGIMLTHAAYKCPIRDTAAHEKFLSLANRYLKNAISSGRLDNYEEEAALELAQSNDLFLRPCRVAHSDRPCVAEAEQMVSPCDDAAKEPLPLPAQELTTEQPLQIQAAQVTEVAHDSTLPVSPRVEEARVSMETPAAQEKILPLRERYGMLHALMQENTPESLQKASDLFLEIADSTGSDQDERDIIALASIQVAAQYHPDCATGRKKRGKILSLSADREKSDHYFNRTVQLGSPTTVVACAIFAHESESYAVADALCEHIIRNNTDHIHISKAFFMQGAIALSRKKSATFCPERAFEFFKKAHEMVGFNVSFDSWSFLTSEEMFKSIDAYVPSVLERVNKALDARDAGESYSLSNNDIHCLYLAGRLYQDLPTVSQERRGQSWAWMESAAQAGSVQARLKMVSSPMLPMRDRIDYLLEMHMADKLSDGEKKFMKTCLDGFATNGHIEPLFIVAEQAHHDGVLSEFLQKLEKNFPVIAVHRVASEIPLCELEKWPAFEQNLKEHEKTSWVARALIDCFALRAVLTHMGDYEGGIAKVNRALARLAKEGETHRELNSILGRGYTILGMLYQKKQAHDDNNERAHAYRKLVYGSYERAIKLGDSEAMVLRAHHHIEGDGMYPEDNRHKGCELLERVVRGDGSMVYPSAPESAAYLTSKYIEWGDFEKAREYHQRAVNLLPYAPPGSKELAKWVENLGTLIQKSGTKKTKRTIVSRYGADKKQNKLDLVRQIFKKVNEVIEDDPVTAAGLLYAAEVEYGMFSFFKEHNELNKEFTAHIRFLKCLANTDKITKDQRVEFDSCLNVLTRRMATVHAEQKINDTWCADWAPRLRNEYNKIMALTDRGQKECAMRKLLKDCWGVYVEDGYSVIDNEKTHKFIVDCIADLEEKCPKKEAV